jgi:hypothetical protein
MTQALYMPGPGRTLTLPENAAVIRCLAGDSLGGGTNAPASTLLADLREKHVRGGAPTSTVLYRDDAFYWSKWYRQDGSSEWSTAYRNVYTSEAENQWLALHDRTGFNQGAAVASLSNALSLGLLWVMHYFANAAPRYRTPSGRLLPIHYVQHNTSSSYVGPFATNTSSWSPTHAAGLFELWQAHYLAPAVNALRAEGKQVFIESMFFTAGGADAATGAGTPGAGNLGQHLEQLLAAMGTRSGGRIPTVLVRPYQSHLPLDWQAAQASFDASMDQFGDFFADYVRMDGIPRAETWPGVHPTSDGLVMFAQRWVEALNRLAARGARLVVVTEDLA